MNRLLEKVDRLFEREERSLNLVLGQDLNGAAECFVHGLAGAVSVERNIHFQRNGAVAVVEDKFDMLIVVVEVVDGLQGERLACSDRDQIELRMLTRS